jgi:hypothetical protein
MTKLEKAFLEAECQECHDEGFITVGKYDQEEVVLCLCKKLARIEKEADGLEGANIQE